jgi:hypothetical protein
MGTLKDLKIFKTNRIGLAEMYNDAMTYIKNIYNYNGKEFSNASPFAQIINVLVNLGRMILFYVETSITELNIETAYQARSIKGLATLTGHVPSRGMAARGTLYMCYNRTSDREGETIYIKNFSKIKNRANNLTYLAIFPTNVMQVTIGAYDTKIEVPIIQGELKYQQATGTGKSLQSLNFANKTDHIVDDFFVNVYVNGKRWESVPSILDMTYEQEACVIRNSFNGGIDVFFGTGNNGKIPRVGSTILFEYVVTYGVIGNVSSQNIENHWEFIDDATDIYGDYISLNEIYDLVSASDILFGTNGESLEMTRLLAPHASRSFVLANPNNYKAFLTKLNIFSIIDAFSGFGTTNDIAAEEKYNTAKSEYQTLRDSYHAQVNLTGYNSTKAQELQNELTLKKVELDALKSIYDDEKLDDNTIYLYLVPDVNKRIAKGESYFTCPIDKFKLTDDEKTAILNLIEDSGQKLITVDNRIIDPIFAKFAMNIFIQILSTHEFSAIKSAIISEISDYLIANNRRDRIPVSDIIKIVEGVDGVDSVTVYFDADKNNSNYFGNGQYGIDQYGDIVLTRKLYDTIGNIYDIDDIRPLFRGGFTSINDVYYDDDINSMSGPINIILRGKTIVK